VDPRPHHHGDEEEIDLDLLGEEDTFLVTTATIVETIDSWEDSHR
jgi:hypothetical protein